MQNLSLPVHALQKRWNLSKKNVVFYLGGTSHQIKNEAVKMELLLTFSSLTISFLILPLLKNDVKNIYNGSVASKEGQQKQQVQT